VLPQTQGALKLWEDQQEKIDKVYTRMLEQLEKIQATKPASVEAKKD